MSREFWIYFSIIAAVIILIIITVFIINIIFTKRKNHKMFTEFADFLMRVCKENDDVSYEKVLSSKKSDHISYDFTLETPKYKYFFKLVPNFPEYEITINNSIKWQIRRSYTDESLNFAPGVEEFMRLDIPNDSNKTNRKIYIIYPNSRSLLKYVNECEMEFVTPDTDIYGTRVITYVALKENPNLLEL